MKAKIIDTPYNVEALAPKLASEGVRCVIRYYNHRNSSTFPKKRLTASEARAISECGMSVGVVFQQWHRDLSNFGKGPAKQDAARAYDIAHNQVGQPEDSTIYFSVDFDPWRSRELAVIHEHFVTLKSELAALGRGGSSYKIGVYGSGTVANMLLADDLVEYVWVPRAVGWSGTRDFLRTDKWHIYQDRDDLPYGGIDYDSNITRQGVTDFGQFAVGDLTHIVPGTRIDDSHSVPVYEVTVRNSLNLRGGPGLDFGVIGSLKNGARVYGMRETGDWMQVDLEGDGTPDGYLYKAYLKALV